MGTEFWQKPSEMGTQKAYVCKIDQHDSVESVETGEFGESGDSGDSSELVYYDESDKSGDDSGHQVVIII